MTIHEEDRGAWALGLMLTVCAMGFAFVVGLLIGVLVS